MPTMEIISVDAKELNLDQSNFSVAIIEENKIKSHRNLFEDFLKNQSGVIIHIGNPEFINDNDIFFANMLVNWDFENAEITLPEFETDKAIINTGANQLFKFKFLDKYKADIDNILKISLENSPIKKIYFLSDYQFGPGEKSIEIIYTISDFWTEHNENGLSYNTLYEMYGL